MKNNQFYRHEIVLKMGLIGRMATPKELTSRRLVRV